jgi:protein-disulfide isomerase
MKKIKNLLPINKKIVVKIVVILLIGLVGWSGLAYAATKIDAEFEAKVLEVIQKNPEAILESVNNYRQQQESQQEQQNQAFLQELTANPQQLIGASPIKGAKNQRIVLAEFSDFECPFCSKAALTLNEFMAKHGNEVTLVYKHFPLVQIHPQAIPAAQAAWAAQQQGKFWEYHDALFAQQNRLGEELYLELAESLNLDLEKFKGDRQKANPEIIKDIQIGQKLGIRGTPFFIMNGQTFSGALSLEQFEQILAQVQSSN